MKRLTNKPIKVGERMVHLVLLAITTLGFMAVFSNQGLSLSHFPPNGAERAGNHESSSLVTSRDSVPANTKPKSPGGDVVVQGCAEADQLRKNVQQLTAEVQRLRKKVADLEKDRQVTAIQDQLTKEEQRGEGLQMRLLDIAEKEGGLQSRVEQVNEQLRPENLDTALAGVGSLRPEDAREDTRKRLSSEKQRIQSQLDLLRQDRMRTQASLASSDASIQRLRTKLNEATKTQ